MEKNEFSQIRKGLGKTQKKLASLLGVSLKAVHSYEQGWRKIPAHVQRDLYFLLFNQRNKGNAIQPCWEQKGCPDKEHCPAWEFKSGTMCWYINGTLCADRMPSHHEKKLSACKSCKVFSVSVL